MNTAYDDIINLPHHISKAHKAMPIIDRAAQFAPFAALTGFGELTAEEARYTDTKRERDLYTEEKLNRMFLYLNDVYRENPIIKVTYFKPDKKKNGGEYITAAKRLLKIDEYNRLLILEEGEIIPFDDIFDIET